MVSLRTGYDFYYPKDYDPEKHRNVNRYHGTHHLGAKANKIHLGILRIRFEFDYCGI